MGTKALLLGVVLTAAAPVVATAQSRPQAPIGSHIPRPDRQDSFDSYTYSREESDREFAAYSNCVVSTSSGQRDSAAFLRMVPGTDEWNAAARKLTRPDCLRNSFGQVKMRFNVALLRPALFAAMYRRQFGKTVPTGFANEPALSLATLYTGPIDRFPPMAAAQLNFGNCVARADAPAAHRLLMAKPWSADENAALPAVAKAMGGCLSNDQTLRLSRSTVRGLIAEAMYHLASAHAAVAVAGAPAAKGR